MSTLIQTSRFEKVLTVEDATARYIDETYYGDGRLEALQHKVEQQSRVICALIEVLPEKHKLKFARKLFGDKLEVFKDN